MAPLSERMRPAKLDELVGQEHLVGKGSILRTAIENGNIPSMIFWGPPGSGKTTIANIIAHTLNVPFYQLSAISSGVKDVRDIIEKAKQQLSATSLSVSEIAYQLGFEHSQSFSKLFKKHFSCTPTTFRHQTMKKSFFTC